MPNSFAFQFYLNRFYSFPVDLEVMSEKWIALTIVYLNDLFRNGGPSSAEVLEKKGHILDIILKYLVLSQVQKCFVEKNLEKKFLQTMTTSDSCLTSKLCCPWTTTFLTCIMGSWAQDRAQGCKEAGFWLSSPISLVVMGTCCLAAVNRERLGILDVLQGLVSMAPDILPFTQNKTVILPFIGGIFCSARSVWTHLLNTSMGKFLWRVGLREFPRWMASIDSSF